MLLRYLNYSISALFINIICMYVLSFDFASSYQLRLLRWLKHGCQVVGFPVRVLPLGLVAQHQLLLVPRLVLILQQVRH